MLQQLRQTIYHGWPDSRKETPECLYPYFDLRDELTVRGELVFKGQQLVVPAALRKELMAVTRATDIGIEGCIRRAPNTLYWPRMSTKLKEYVSKCDVCLAHQSAPSKEPLLPHEMVARPWSKVAADLCELDGRTLLVVTDYYSNFIEVARLNSATSRSVIKDMKDVFARYGIPDVLVTDNGAQFASVNLQPSQKPGLSSIAHRPLVTHNLMESLRTPGRRVRSSASSQNAKHQASPSTLLYSIGETLQPRVLEPVQHNAFSVAVASRCCQCLVHCSSLDTQQKKKREP